MLVQKCGVTYLRDKLTEAIEPVEGEESEINNWDKLVTSLIKIRVEDCNPKTPNVPVDNSQRIEDEVSKRIKKRLVECDGGSWPCPRCDKYFLGEHFVLNHILKKHANKIAESKRKVIQAIMMENYANDKNKIIGGDRDQGTRGGYNNQGKGGYNNNYRRDGEVNRNYRGGGSSYRGGRDGGDRGARRGDGGQGDNRGRHNFDYRDLDDPKAEGKVSVKNTRSLINYDDI